MNNENLLNVFKDLMWVLHNMKINDDDYYNDIHGYYYFKSDFYTKKWVTYYKMLNNL